MNHVTTFKTLFGDTLPSGSKGYILDMTNEPTTNPFLLLSRHTGSEGGKMAIRNRVMYICASSFEHPNAKQLAIS